MSFARYGFGLAVPVAATRRRATGAAPSPGGEVTLLSAPPTLYVLAGQPAIEHDLRQYFKGQFSTRVDTGWMLHYTAEGGSLPAGLALSTYGTIGAPDAVTGSAGSYPITLRATDPWSGLYAETTLTVEVVTHGTTALPNTATAADVSSALAAIPSAGGHVITVAAGAAIGGLTITEQFDRPVIVLAGGSSMTIPAKGGAYQAALRSAMTGATFASTMGRVRFNAAKNVSVIGFDHQHTENFAGGSISETIREDGECDRVWIHKAKLGTANLNEAYHAMSAGVKAQADLGGGATDPQLRTAWDDATDAVLGARR